MDALRRVQLCIVPSEDVRPHEVADPGRETRIEQRLRNDAMLRDPLIVGSVADVDGYVLLDGTNRQRALANLGLSRVLVQVIDYADPNAVHLRTWCHLAATDMLRLLEGVRNIGGIEVSALPPLGTSDALESPATLAVLLDRTERYALTRDVGGRTSRAELLRRLVDLYETGLTRVDCDRDEVEERAGLTVGNLGVLVAFPSFSRSQVVATAMSGALIPAGITRHVIQNGRALRVNLPLGELNGAASLEQANASLQVHLEALQPRLYQEPTILYDS